MPVGVGGGIVLGTGGAKAVTPDDVVASCESAITHANALALSTGCAPADAAECSSLTAVMGVDCLSELAAAFDCGSRLPAAGFQCDAGGQVTFGDSACPEETAALTRCYDYQH